MSVWLPVKVHHLYNYEGKWAYEVSDDGQVRRAGYWGYKHRKYHQPRLMKLQDDMHGRKKVTLQSGGRAKTCHVHRLVAQAFIHNPYRYKWVIHKDGDISNNHVSNLEWVDSTSKTPHVMSMSKAVRQYTTGGVLLAEYPSASAAQRVTGFDHSTIAACCHRKKRRVTAYGFIWRFVTDDEFYKW